MLETYSSLMKLVHVLFVNILCIMGEIWHSFTKFVGVLFVCVLATGFGQKWAFSSGKYISVTHYEVNSLLCKMFDGGNSIGMKKCVSELINQVFFFINELSSQIIIQYNGDFAIQHQV